MLGNILGDEAILKAMISNEVDTNTAYQKITSHDGIWEEAVLTLHEGLEDEKRHKTLIENLIRRLDE